MTTATGAPSSRLRVITRDGQKLLQQAYHVTFDPGTAQEKSMWVWLDIPEVEETRVEAEARRGVESMKERFVVATNQFVR